MNNEMLSKLHKVETGRLNVKALLFSFANDSVDLLASYHAASARCMLLLEKMVCSDPQSGVSIVDVVHKAELTR